jgi:hypothetical protein
VAPVKDAIALKKSVAAMQKKTGGPVIGLMVQRHSNKTVAIKRV